MTAQPATGTDAEELARDCAEAQAGADRGEHLRQARLVELDPVRGGEPEHEPSWFSVSTGKSAPGTKIATPRIAFLREKLSIRWSQTASRSTGTRAASGAARSSSRAASAPPISSTGKPVPGGQTTTSVASTYGTGTSSWPLVWTARTGTRATVGRPQLALVLLARRAAEDADERRRSLEAAARRDGAGRGAFPELARELVGERAADHERTRTP